MLVKPLHEVAAMGLGGLQLQTDAIAISRVGFAFGNQLQNFALVGGKPGAAGSRPLFGRQPGPMKNLGARVRIIEVFPPPVSAMFLPPPGIRCAVRPP
jgi:hypothetical protein